MTLAELGAKLREAREARNMSVADVADRLKIPGRILHGVEEAADHLPRTVYVYHFIKDYAKLMGFPAADVAQWMATLEGFENLGRPAIAESQPFTSVKPSMLPVVLGAVLKLVFIAALAFGAYTAYVHFFAARDYEEVTPAQETSAAPAAPAWDVPAPPAAPAPAEAPAASAAVSEAAPEKAPAEQAAPEKTAGEKPVAVAPQWDVPAAPAMPEEGPAVTQAPSLPEAAVPASAEALVSQPGFDDAAPVTADPAAPVVSPASQDAQPGFVALPEGMHHVEVIADVDECWMGFTPDGRRQQRTLSKGDSYTMTFRDSLVVKLGNAGAVRVIYDGKELERAAAGRVVTLRFPPEE